MPRPSVAEETHRVRRFCIKGSDLLWIYSPVGSHTWTDFAHGMLLDVRLICEATPLRCSRGGQSATSNGEAVGTELLLYANPPEKSDEFDWFLIGYDRKEFTFYVVETNRKIRKADVLLLTGMEAWAGIRKRV
ncbi:MAG TPA: hypothetical protein VGE62_01915 [Candidatus Paceibacterota bacterium]